MRFLNIVISKPVQPRHRPILTLALAAALLGLGAAWMATIPENAAAKSTQRVVLGSTSSRPVPNCGALAADRECSVEGKVTVFQSLTKGIPGRSFVVPFKSGRVVSWSITLSRPLRADTTINGKKRPAESPFFNELFGAPAKAKIAILRQVEKWKKGPPRYKMVRQSPTQILNPYFGRTVHFALVKPLGVAKDQVVALTIPTWAPAFWTPKACTPEPTGGLIDEAACNRSKKVNSYRASRGVDKCKLGRDDDGSPNEALAKTRPQQKVNSVKPYACYYTGSRLLYTATVVAK